MELIHNGGIEFGDATSIAVRLGENMLEQQSISGWSQPPLVAIVPQSCRQGRRTGITHRVER